MLSLDCYIHAASWIAPDENADVSKGWRSAEPGDLSAHIPLMQLRRMSKIVRMGMAGAIACKEQARQIIPDAITVGTAWGCIQDTEQFLKKLVTQEEQMLTPTAFIQSTHNTVAGQIALMMDCKGYNNTLSQNGFSFESSVLSSVLYLNEHPDHSILCGGVDEMNETAFQWMKRAGLYSTEPLQPVAGEGAGFLLLNKNAEGAKACIRGLHLFSNDLKKAKEELREIFQNEKTSATQDRLWMGLSEDSDVNEFFSDLDIEWKADVHFFKIELGEWATVIAAAVAKASQEIQVGERIWMVKQFCGQRSLWLMEGV
jgi:hypothetical protein